MLRRVAFWWHLLRFKYRWRQIYRRASHVEGIANLHLSVCDADQGQRLTASCSRVWRQVPAEIRDSLEQHWSRLQRSWDRRETSVPLHIPIFGVFDGTEAIVGEFGMMSGLAVISGLKCGFTDAPDATVRLFAGLFLPMWKNHLRYSDDGLDLEMARRFASYFLWTKDRGEPINFMFLWHQDTDELVKQWWFCTDVAAAP